jgi:hypothetical protein
MRRGKSKRARWRTAGLIIFCLLAWHVSTVRAAVLTWPTNHYLPTFPKPASVIQYIDVTSATTGEQALFQSLEGIVNRTQPRIACLNSTTSEGEFTWMNLHNLSFTSANGYNLILEYESSFNGLVVYDTNQGDTLNLATTIAGVKNELMCDPSLLATLTNAPYNLAVKDDLRGLFTTKYQVYGYLYSNYWSQCNHRIIAGLETNSYWQLRDYLVAVQAAVVWLDPSVSADAATLGPFTSGMRPVGGIYLGWWPNESGDLEWIATYGIPVIASDFFDNGSLFSGVAVPISIPSIPSAPTLQNKIYVSITLSDGDNMQYMQHALYGNWSSSARGSVPMGWTVQPLAADLDPGMLNFYSTTATANDCLVAGPSGAGYTRINYWSAANLAAYTSASEPYLQRTGIRAATVWLTVSSSTADAYASNCPVLVGINDYSDGYYTSNYLGLPTIGFPSNGNYETTASDLLIAITNVGATWTGSAPMFIAVEGSGWDITPANCQTIASSLSSNYTLVRPDHLFLLYRQAAGLGEAGAVPYVATPPASQLAGAGSNATFNVIASGTGPLRYQWRTNGANIPGASYSSLTLSDVQSSNAGSYSVVVSNSYGTATSTAAVLMVETGAPQIFTGVQSPFYAMLGQTFSNSVVAAGASPLAYQWQFNGTNLVDGGRVLGSQSNVLMVASAEIGDAGNYQVIVTNNYGAVTSSVAVLTVAGGLPLSFNAGGTGWTANGSASLTASKVLTLTSPSGLGNDGSFFFQDPQYIGAFQAAFTYQAGGNKQADGVSFCLQNDPRGVSALGGAGGDLGVGSPTPIMPSVELELNIYNSHVVGYAFATNGTTLVYTTPGSINVASGDPISITMNYANDQMRLTFTDTVTRTSFTTNLNVGNLAQIVGGSNAYVGFTGAYGGDSSVQTISNFTFVSIVATAIQPIGSNASILWPGAAAGYVLQQNSDLTTTNWVNVTNQTIITNGSNQVTVPAAASNLFYRLVLPEP